MSREIWLRSNRRVPAALAILSTLALTAALIAIAFSESSIAIGVSVAGVGGALVALGFVVRWLRRPRLAYGEGKLAAYVAGTRPICIPIELVECFFLGQGPSLLPGAAFGAPHASIETANLIVRLSESAAEWKHRDVHPWLALWCEGYITIRGTWCEPLHGDLVAGLNRRLVEVHRMVRSQHAPLEG